MAPRPPEHRGLPEDPQLRVDLPGDFPPGPAEIIVLTEIPSPRTVVRLGGVLRSTSPNLALDEDPIAEALKELRTERADLLERRVRRYEADDSGRS